MEKIKMLISQIEEGEYTGREILLAGAVLFLSGTLIGILLSPNANISLGCNNGNNCKAEGQLINKDCLKSKKGSKAKKEKKAEEEK